MKLLLLSLTPLYLGHGCPQINKRMLSKASRAHIISPATVASTRNVPVWQPEPAIPGQVVPARGLSGNNTSPECFVLITATIVGFPGSSCWRDSRDSRRGGAYVCNECAFMVGRPCESGGKPEQRPGRMRRSMTNHQIGGYWPHALLGHNIPLFCFRC